MVRQPRIVAWSSQAELLTVRNLFYAAQSDRDERQHAVHMVKAWQIRARLPHAIESTAQLTDALLHDHAGTSQLISQLAYSTSICRFVNGLLDPAQKSHFALPMHVLAQNLGLPASFVEIRHAATHEAMPSLIVLRKACERALDWLWENYWRSIDSKETGPVVAVEAGLESMAAAEETVVDLQKAEIRALLKRWLKMRKTSAGTIEDVMSRDSSAAAASILKGCMAVCADQDGLENFVDVLLDEKSLIPSGDRKQQKVPGAILIWSSLLENLQHSVENFFRQLVNTMLESLDGTQQDQTNQPKPDEEEYLGAIYTWLEYIVLKDGLCRGADSINVDDLVKRCLVEPNQWNIRLVKKILSTSSSLKAKYINLLSLAEEQVPSPTYTSRQTVSTNGTTLPAVSADSIADELAEFENRLQQMQSGRKTKPVAFHTQGQAVDTPRGILTTEVTPIAQIQAGKFRKNDGAWRGCPIGSVAKLNIL